MTKSQHLIMIPFLFFLLINCGVKANEINCSNYESKECFYSSKIDKNDTFGFSFNVMIFSSIAHINAITPNNLSSQHSSGYAEGKLSDNIEKKFNWGGMYRNREDSKKIWFYLPFSILTVFFFVTYLKKNNRSISLDQANPNSIKYKKDRIYVYNSTGEITSYQNKTVTVTRVHGNQNGVSSSVEENEYDRFMYRDESGIEHAVQLVNSGIRIREGNIITAFWAVKNGNQKGSYIGFYNHHTRGTTLLNQTIRGFFSYDISPALFFSIALFFTLGLLIILTFGETMTGTQIFLTLLGFFIYWIADFSQFKSNVDSFINNGLKKILAEQLQTNYEQMQSKQLM